MTVKKETKKIEKIVQNPYLILLSYLLAIFDATIFKCEVLWVVIVFHSISALYLIFLTVFIIRRYFSLKKYQKNIVETLNAENSIVYNLLQEFGNTIVDSSLKVKKKNDLDYDHFKVIVKNICSNISRIVLRVSGVEFSVCVKAFSLNDLLETEYDNMSTITLARETKNYLKRTQNDNNKQRIADNTSFKELLDRGDYLWSCADLSKLDPQIVAGSSYKNPDANYREYYKSTIVVPIRSRIEIVNQRIVDYSNHDSKATFHCLGFLCVDSLESFEDDDERFTKLFDIMILFGTALYPLLENFLANEIERV